MCALCINRQNLKYWIIITLLLAKGLCKARIHIKTCFSTKNSSIQVFKVFFWGELFLKIKFSWAIFDWLCSGYSLDWFEDEINFTEAVGKIIVSCLCIVTCMHDALSVHVSCISLYGSSLYGIFSTDLLAYAQFQRSQHHICSHAHDLLLLTRFCIHAVT